MKTKLINKMKASFFNWISKGIAPYIIPINENIIKKTDIYALAAVSPVAQLSHEAIIENFKGEQSAITVGEHTYVRGRLLTFGHGGSIKIGKWSYIGLHTEIWSMNSIIIGDRVLISHGVNIHDGSAHSLNADERHQHFRHILEKGHPIDEIPGVKSAPIIIEDDVWISFGVTILKGVKIGKGSVIAAGAIVTEDVPPGVLYKCKITPLITKLSDMIST